MPEHDTVATPACLGHHDKLAAAVVSDCLESLGGRRGLAEWCRWWCAVVVTWYGLWWEIARER